MSHQRPSDSFSGPENSYSSLMKRHRILTHEQTVALIIRAQSGDEKARHEVIEGNMRLVSAIIARRFAGYVKHWNNALEQGDLFQEGVVGLQVAVSKFEPERGYRFSTYATFWIVQHVQRAIDDQALTIRFPVHVWDKLRFDSKRGDGDIFDLVEEFKYDGKKGLPMASNILDAPASGQNHTCPATSEVVGDRLADEAAHDDQLNAVHQNSLQTDVESALQILTAREREVLQMRFGMNGHEAHTLEAIAQKIGVTRERVRQIQDGAKKKLKREMPQLAEYLEN